MSNEAPDYELMLMRCPALKRALDRRWLEDGEMSAGEREDFDQLLDKGGDVVNSAFVARESFDKALGGRIPEQLLELAKAAGQDFLPLEPSGPRLGRRRAGGPRQER